MNVKVFAGLLPLFGAAACYREVSSPQTPVSYGWSNQASATVQGPPGGQMDPGFAYGSPDQPGYPQGYPDGYAGGYPLGTEYGAEAPAAPSVDPQDPQPPAEGPVDPYGVGAVDDNEIDTTLNGYGEWIEDDVYGRVWRPYVTVVGVDFTPYETCGSWVWTDYGWTFACTDWAWGWLPFHYGQWAWFDDFGWGWCPGYEWSPAWVDWRDGGGYVGWRPSKPRIRDHRNGRPDGPTVRDHRKHRISEHDSHWRFATTTDFGRPHIRAHTYKNIADGLKQTSIVSAPTVKGAATVNASKVMQQRIAARQQRQEVRDHRQPQMYRPDSRQPAQSLDQRPDRPRPSYQPARPTYQPPQQTYQPPGRPQYQPPARPTYQPPSRPTYQPPQQTYRPPQQTYQPPARPTYQPPSRPTYQPPSRPTYQPPSRPTYSPPTRDYSSGSRGGSYSSGSRGGGGGSSSSPPSRSSGGGSHSSGGSKSSSSSSSSSKSSGSSHSSSHSSGGRSHR